jgi:hypothetical protein
VTVNTAVQTGVVFTEKERMRLIAQRNRLLGLDEEGRKIEAAVPEAIPAQETQDPIFQRWEFIGKAESWQTGKGSEPENHTGSFGPWPEEYEI